MRMAFCVDGYREQVGVEVRQDSRGVHCLVHGATEVQGAADVDVVRAQVARVLSLDHDGTGFEAIGDRDPVMARLLAAAPGLRPPMFYSPYEAAAWAVLSARRQAGQMARLREQLSTAHGAVFALAGKQVAALPLPSQLLAVDAFPGLPPDKLGRLHGVARAALDGVLDLDRLRAAGPEAAAEQVQQIKGIGPFYASLITIRACGWADILPSEEPRSRGAHPRALRHRPRPDRRRNGAPRRAWRPFRTWATVLIRAAAGRLA